MAKPVVSIIILTYNQERFIRQCIESVLSQRTTYPYEIIIGEDMGTDRTRAICKQYADDYPQVILPDRETNLGVTMNWIKCVELASGACFSSSPVQTASSSCTNNKWSTQGIRN